MIYVHAYGPFEMMVGPFASQEAAERFITTHNLTDGRVIGAKCFSMMPSDHGLIAKSRAGTFSP